MGTNILKKIQITLFISGLCFMAACNKGCNDQKLKVDVDEVKVEISYQRFDLDLFKCKDAEDIIRLKENYKSFYFDFVFRVLGFKPIDSDSLCTTQMLRFVSDSNMLSLQDSIKKVFNDDKFLMEGLTEAMKHYKYYFKTDSVLPRFIGFPSLLHYPNIFSDDYIGIGLDMYLGKDFPYYYDSRLDYPKYLIDKFIKEYALRNTIRAFIEQKFEQEPSIVFIERAVQQGKIYYMLDALCPEMPDTIKIQYSNTKLNWIKAVEKEMWIDFVNRKVLYEKDGFENDKYFSDGPFTNAPNVSRDSPPRVGEWLGWQIVRKYMENHSTVTLPELMNEKDLMKIFKDSGYRPK